MRGKIKRQKPIEISLPIYRRYVIVSIGMSVAEIVKYGIRHGISKGYFTDAWKAQVSEMIADHRCDGFTTEYGVQNTDVLVWLRKKPRRASEYGTLYHELCHAVDHVAWATDEQYGWYTEDGISEPRAFLYEYLANTLNKILWDQK